MTQKERLVDIIDQMLDEGQKQEAVVLDSCYATDLAFIADYLLKNGVIVPPCKVGDHVYFLQRPSYIQKTFIYTGTVARITFVENIEILIYRDEDESFYYRKPEHVFATKAAAEQALTVFQFKDEEEQALRSEKNNDLCGMLKKENEKHDMRRSVKRNESYSQVAD